MNNFAIKIGNKEYWISRSVAAVGFIFCKMDDNWHILAAQRGHGAADNVGKWNCPCGYLDYNETVAECCAREIFEETGYEISPLQLTFLDVDDTSSDANQNIVFKYMAIVQLDFKAYHVNNFYCEPNEVSQVKWLTIRNLNQRDWAFNHENLIREIYDTYLINSK